MYLADYHTHSTLSPDSTIPLEALCENAVRLGLREVCITDHWNLAEQNGALALSPFPWQPALEQWAALRERYAGRLELRLGLEVGNGQLDDALAARTLDLPQLDFAIGSIHNLSEAYRHRGAYSAALRVTTAEEGTALLADYMQELWSLSRTGNFDVMGHILYPLRYLPPEFGLTLAPWQDVLVDLLKNLIAGGRGIEFNTKGGGVEEYVPLLELYRSLGGEVLTFGSDAHQVEQIGCHLAEAYELAKAAGFRYFTVYRGRTPEFVRL